MVHVCMHDWDGCIEVDHFSILSDYAVSEINV